MGWVRWNFIKIIATTSLPIITSLFKQDVILFKQNVILKKWNFTFWWAFSSYLMTSLSKPSGHRFLQNQQLKHWKKVWNLFKANNKDVGLVSLLLFLKRFPTLFWHFIADIEQVNGGLEGAQELVPATFFFENMFCLMFYNFRLSLWGAASPRPLNIKNEKLISLWLFPKQQQFSVFVSMNLIYCTNCCSRYCFLMNYWR